MTDHRRIQQMLRTPKAMMAYQATGRLPALNIPVSPLITLIESIPVGYHHRITNVVVCPELGYRGHHRFHNLAQAMNWLKPSHIAQCYPSESWRLKRFCARLSIQDLYRHCQIPEQLERELLRRIPR